MNTFIDLFSDESLLRLHHEKIQPTHIFHQLIENYADRLSETELRFLYEQFEDVEKALTFSRRRELHPAGLIFQKIDAHQMEYPDWIWNGVWSRLKAARAYYEYACGRNEKGIELLRQALGHALTQSMNFPLMITAGLEQWRNINIVRIRQGDLNGALSDMNALISFALTGEASGMCVEERFRFDAGGVISDQFWKLDHETHYNALTMVTESAFRGAMDFCNNDFALAGDLFRQIISEAVDAMQGRRALEWARSSIALLHLFYTGQKERFLEGISRQFEDFQQAVPSLQWLIISNYLVLAREAGFDLETHPNYERLSEAYRSLEYNTDLLKPAESESESIQI